MEKANGGERMRLYKPKKGDGKELMLIFIFAILFVLFLLVLYLLLPYIMPFIVAVVAFIICLSAFGLL